MNVRALQNSSVIGEKLPQEMLDAVREHIVSGSAIAGNTNVLNARDQTVLIMDLEIQVDDLYDAVERMNKQFWPALLDSREHTHNGNFEEGTALQHNYDA